MRLRTTAFGLSQEAKSQLLERLASRRAAQVQTQAAKPAPSARPALGDLQEREEFRRIRKAGEILEIGNPFFRAHDGIAGAETTIEGRRLINLVSYNYLGLNGDPRVSAASKHAIDLYGTSVSASRIVSGERPIHRALEAALAELHGTEDCVAIVSGHATNVTVIGRLVGAGDAVVHDALSHNSIIQGAILSGAQRLQFAHNDVAALRCVLRSVRGRAKRILVAIEGHYSMDGDVPDLAATIDAARENDAYLMVDEAHSVGVLGATGRGIAEHCAVDPSEVDIWMGTLSKTLSGCGGYIAASRDLVDYLRCSAPGLVYSVGLSPPLAAAALASLTVMRAEPWRVERLNSNARLFLDEARVQELDTGSSIGAAIVPVILGSSIRAARVADILFRNGINVQPILRGRPGITAVELSASTLFRPGIFRLFDSVVCGRALSPAVPERSARLRFFLSSLHTPEQVRIAVAETARACDRGGKTYQDRSAGPRYAVRPELRPVLRAIGYRPCTGVARPHPLAPAATDHGAAARGSFALVEGLVGVCADESPCH